MALMVLVAGVGAGGVYPVAVAEGALVLGAVRAGIRALRSRAYSHTQHQGKNGGEEKNPADAIFFIHPESSSLKLRRRNQAFGRQVLII
jgi:hypothetical protein